MKMTEILKNVSLHSSAKTMDTHHLTDSQRAFL